MEPTAIPTIAPVPKPAFEGFSAVGPLDSGLDKGKVPEAGAKVSPGVELEVVAVGSGASKGGPSTGFNT